MIKVEVIEDFNLKDFHKIKNLKRKCVDFEGKLFEGDTFECTKEMCEYLDGGNKLKKSFIKVIEVQPKKK